MRNGDEIPGLVAAADLSSKQYHVMAFASTAGQVKTAVAASTVLVGILQNDPTAGQAARVQVTGVSLAIAGTSVITAGLALKANSTGQVVNTAVDNSGIVGRALEASGAAGDQILVLVTGPSRY